MVILSDSFSVNLRGEGEIPPLFVRLFVRVISWFLLAQKKNRSTKLHEKKQEGKMENDEWKMSFGFAIPMTYAAKALLSGIDTKAFNHPVERPPINSHNFSSARAIAAGGLEHVYKVAALQLVE